MRSCATSAMGFLLMPWLCAQEAPVASDSGHLASGPLLAFVAADRLQVAELDGTKVFELGHGIRLPGLLANLQEGVLARLDRDALLVRLPDTDRLEVHRPASGPPVMLAGGSTRDALVVGDDVVFLDGHLDGILHRVSWRLPTDPRPIVDERFASIGALRGNLVFAVGAAQGSVSCVNLVAARTHRLWTRSPANAMDRPCIALSPGGQRLAIGSVGAGGMGRIDVVDVATGTPVRSFPDLPVKVSALSSDMPRMEVAFLDDDHVICSESRADLLGVRGAFVFVTRALRSGEVVDEEPYGPLGIHHQQPSPPVKDAPQPVFELRDEGEDRVLVRVASQEVLWRRARQEVTYEDVSIATDGRWACVRAGAARTELLVFGPSGGAPRAIAHALATDLHWLPAAR